MFLRFALTPLPATPFNVAQESVGVIAPSGWHWLSFRLEQIKFHCKSAIAVDEQLAGVMAAFRQICRSQPSSLLNTPDQGKSRISKTFFLLNSLEQTHCAVVTGCDTNTSSEKVYVSTVQG